MAMTPLPTPPSRSDPDNFAERGDAFLGALPLFQQEMDALGEHVDSQSEEVDLKTRAAADAASGAETYAGSADDSARRASDSASDAEDSEVRTGEYRDSAAQSAADAGRSAADAENHAASINPQLMSSDYAGPNEPETIWPFMTWADTGTLTRKRRNGADTAWVIEGRLFRSHMPIIPADEVPTVDIGPIYIVGKGNAEWDGTAYAANDIAASDVAYGNTASGLAAEDVQAAIDELSSLVMQPVITGSVTFTKFTNNIQLAGIRDKLALEPGDVIQISGSTSNDNLYTVESITDADNLIVNYEHRNGAGSLSLTDESVTATLKRIAKWFNAPTGLGHAWVDFPLVTNTAYQAPRNRTTSLLTSITGSGIGVHISDDGVNWWMLADSSGGSQKVLSVEIPQGKFFKNTTPGAGPATRMMR